MNRPFLVVLIVAAVVLLGIVLLMWRARRAASAVAAPASAKPAAKRWRWVDVRETVTRRYATVDRAVRYLVSRRDWRYRSNWLLLLGMPGDGKSSLLASVPDDLLRRARGADARNQAFLRAAVPHTQWQFLEQGALIDPDGTTSPGADPLAEQRWKQILNGIESLRPDRAVDGMICVLSATRLVAGGDALDEVARQMFTRVYTVQERYAYALPVYVVVTQCDAVPGFEAFWSAQDASLRREIVGWSSPTLDDNGTPGQWVDKAFLKVMDGLRTLVLASAAERDRIDDVDGFFLFPQFMRGMQASLQRILDVVFKPNMYETRAFCRGIYFVGPSGPVGPIQAGPRKDIGFLAELLRDKAMAERGLAQRTRKGLLARNRLIRGLQIATAVTALLLGLALPWTAVQVSDRATALHDMVVDVSSSSDALAKGGCLDAPRFYDLIERVTQLDTRTRYLAIPASWVDRRINHGVIRTVSEKALGEVLLPSLACRLQSRIDKLSVAVLDVAGRDTAPDTAFAQVHGQLNRQLNDLATLEDMLHSFKDLSRPDYRDGHEHLLVEEFDGLVRYVYGKPLPKRAMTEGNAFEQALNQAAYAHPPEITGERRMQLIGKFDQMADQARHDLEQRVASGVPLLTALRDDKPPVLPTLRAFNDWLRWVSTDWLLSTPTDNPCVREARALQPGVDELVVRHGYDASLKDALNHFGADACYDPAVESLRQATLPPYGPLFSVDPKTLAMQGVSPGLTAESNGLKTLAGLGFMHVTSAQAFSCDGSAGGFRAGAFDEVLGQLREYQKFTGQMHASDDLVEGSDPLYDRIARAQLKRSVEDSLARHQRARVTESGSPGLDAVSLLDRELTRESALLSASIGPLLQSLQQLRQLRLDSVADRVGQCARNYASGMLMDVSGLASASQLYDPPVQAAADGEDTPLFDVGTTPVLQAYLQRQLGRAQVLAGYAAPFVTLLKNSRGTSDNRRLNAQTDLYWDNTIDQLDRAIQFAEPAGQVGALDDFFLKQLATLTYGNCASALAAYHPPAGGNDLFSMRREAMQSQAQLACTAQGRAGSEVHFFRIAMLFNSEMAGRYPFGLPNSHEVSPETVRAFFTYYATEKGPLTAYLATAKGDRAAQMKDFVAQLDATQAFFAGNLSAMPASAPITLTVGFRARPQDSPQSNQLVAWTLDAGGSKTGWPDASTPVSWNVGQPLSLDLAWADHSRYTPVPDPDQADLGVSGYHAVFHADGPWALLHFIDAHRAAATGSDALAPSQLVLGFRVPVLLTSPLPGERATDEGRLYMTLGLSANDPTSKAAAPLTLPDFPRKAPELW